MVQNPHTEQYEADENPELENLRLHFKVNVKNAGGDNPIEEIYLQNTGPTGPTRIGWELPEDGTAHVSLNEAHFDEAKTEIKKGWTITYDSTRQTVGSYEIEMISAFTWSMSS